MPPPVRCTNRPAPSTPSATASCTVTSSAPSLRAWSLARLGVPFDVEPPRGNAIASQEVANVMRLLGEAMSDHAHPARLERGAGLPRGQQILDHRVEMLLGRIPRLQQVVVERDLVDRL